MFQTMGTGVTPKSSVQNYPTLKIQFPMDTSEVKAVVLKSQNKSSFVVLDGCVWALDGWLFWINFPLGKVIHNQCYGISLQVVCDSWCKFTNLSRSSPGQIGDSRGFHGAALSSFLQEIL